MGVKIGGKHKIGGKLKIGGKAGAKAGAKGKAGLKVKIGGKIGGKLKIGGKAGAKGKVAAKKPTGTCPMAAKMGFETVAAYTRTDRSVCKSIKETCCKAESLKAYGSS